MQNKYTADIGDFGKYGFLKAATCGIKKSGPNLLLGVIWYLVPDEEGKSDGRLISYLTPTQKNKKLYRSCDPDLYDKLAKVIKDGRCVENIKKYQVLPDDTLFYEDILDFNNLPAIGPHARQVRLKHRERWATYAFEKTSKCDIVFFDPDNGIEISSTKKYHKKGPKYVFLDEITPYWKREQSIIIYQHLNHNLKAGSQINQKLLQLKKHLRVTSGLFALQYHRGTSRIFLVIPNKRHLKILLKRSRDFMAGPWGQHFELF